MGYIFTFGFLLLATVAIITLYSLAPQRVRDCVNAFIDEVGGEA